MPSIHYTDHIEFVCIVITDGQPDKDIPPRPYTRDSMWLAMPNDLDAMNIDDLPLYGALVDDDGDIWVRIANPKK